VTRRIIPAATQEGEPVIAAAAKNKLRVGPIRGRQQKPIKQEQHHQQREQREKHDNKESLRSTDEALKLFNLIDHSFDRLGDDHAPDAPHTFIAMPCCS
jgi:hypothetical protein